ncbi:hypothetical protein M758_4G001600 [Ceratodon purpureus]|uniref:Uncharacterized protein n=1 Tax=Ceratodon purpureus TaxID=3225 RepID=A0A8T0I630_CERPU|nr:hypothetical protein KC19_4G001900 [Ceratodon purpureus]KAG0617603.1 hypothetical protein M758_4G001600 [Ceratodon purpureus]
MYSESGGPGDASLFAGGGFMPSQSATGTQFGSSAVTGASRRAGGHDGGLQPLTVKMISQAAQKPGDDAFYVDGLEVNNVTLVGMVHDKDERNIDTSFMLDDTTGRIEIKRWIDGQDSYEYNEMQSVQNSMYVRVHGHLRTFQNKLNVVAFSVRPITDFNEVTFHFLEVIYVHLSHTRGKGGAAGSTPALGNTVATGQNGIYGPPKVPAAASTIPSGNAKEECQKRVHSIYEEPASLQVEQGLHVDQVCTRMTGFSRAQVREAIDFLVNEGYIYSTIDDDHHKSTNG